MVVSMLFTVKCLLESLRVRKGGVVGRLPALEANDSLEDLVVRRSEASEVLRAVVIRYTGPALV